MGKTSLKLYSMDEMQDKYIGKKGSPAREAYAQELQMGILAQTIKQLRQEHKLTREQLGKLAGIQKSEITKLENIVGSASIECIVKVLKVLNAEIRFTVLVKGHNKEIHGIIDSSMRDYGNDPVFVRRAEEAKELINKVGLPEEFYRKK